MPEKYIPNLQSPEEKRKLSLDALFGFLGIRDSEEDQKEVKEAILKLREEIEKTPKVGRMLEENKARRNEFVIPVTSREQRESITEALVSLDIYAWEEDGLLIIDHRRDLEKLQLAGLARGSVYQEEKQQEEISTGVDIQEKMYQFPLPKPKPEEKKNITEKKSAPKTEAEELDPEEDEIIPPEADTELLEIIDKFDRGILEEDDEEFKEAFGNMPTLALFPHKYVKKGKNRINAHTREVITPEDELNILRKAQDGDVKAREQYIRLNVGFVVYVARLVNRRFGGDIDDLFQEGLLGLDHALDKYSEDHESGAKFTTYAVHWIESYMRRYLAQKRNVIEVPVHVADERGRVRKSRREEEKKEQLLGPNYPSDPETRIYLQNLANLERKLFIGAKFDPIDPERFDKENWNQLDQRKGRSITAERLVEEGDQQERVDIAALKKTVNQMLNMLTPRQERVLRLRFGLGDTKQVVIPGFEPGERAPTAEYTDGLSLEEVAMTMDVTRERIRQIEAKALRILKHPSRSRKLIRFVEEAYYSAWANNPSEARLEAEIESKVKSANQPKLDKAPAEQKKINDPSRPETIFGNEAENWITLNDLAQGFGVAPQVLWEHTERYRSRKPSNFRSVGKLTDKYLETYVFFQKDIIKDLEEHFANLPSSFLKGRKYSEIGVDERAEKEKKEWLTPEAFAEEFGSTQEKVERIIKEFGYRQRYPELFYSRGELTEGQVKLNVRYNRKLMSIFKNKPLVDKDSHSESQKILEQIREENLFPKGWRKVENLKTEFGMSEVDILLLAMNYRSTNPEWFNDDWLHPDLVHILKLKAKEQK